MPALNFTYALEQFPDAGRIGNTSLEWTLEGLRAAEGRRGVARSPGRMFATLGGFVFEVTGSLTDLEGSEEYNFAEHRTIEGKPSLQYTGDSLQEGTLGFTLHADWCNPSAALAQLQAIGRAHEAVPLSWADGGSEGIFVVTRLRWKKHETDPEGRPFRITGQIELREWAEAPAAGADATVAGGAAVGDAALVRGAVREPPRPATTNPRAVPVSQILRWG